MQITKRRIETISESVTLLIIRQSTARTREDWCEKCNADVFWIKAGAQKLFGISDLSALPRAVHNNGGEFCSRSLIEQIKKERDNEK